MAIDTLTELRQQIDETDHDLLRLLAKRQNLIKRVGEFKKKNKIQVLQPNRWNEVLTRNTEIGGKLGLSTKVVIDIWERIHQEALSIEGKV